MVSSLCVSESDLTNAKFINVPDYGQTNYLGLASQFADEESGRANYFIHYTT